MKKKEVREALIKDKMKDIIDSVNMVSDNLPDSYGAFLELGLIKHGLYKKIEFALENVIDICAIINSDLDLGSPETEDSIFNHLEEGKIFDKKILEIIRDMKKFRNILVHRYGKIDDKKAFENIKEGLKDFELIIDEIEGFLEKYKRTDKTRKKK